jgi:hypothetical protein
VVVALVAVGGLWYLAHDTGRVAADASQAIVNAPAKANHVALESDLTALSVSVEAVIGEDNGHLPTVTLRNQQYVVTGTSVAGTATPASPGATAVSLTGTAANHCLQITAGADAVHVTSGGALSDGPC